MSKRLHLKYPLILSAFNTTWNFSADFRKNTNIKFNQNPSSGSRVVPCGQTDGQMDGETDIKLIVVFRNFANVPKKEEGYWICHILRSNCLLKHLSEAKTGEIEVTGRRGKTCKQLLDYLKVKDDKGNWKRKHATALCGKGYGPVVKIDYGMNE
jgi:hypothetical protein